MFEYGAGSLEQNDVAMADISHGMSPAAVALAELMAAEDIQLDTDDCDED